MADSIIPIAIVINNSYAMQVSVVIASLIATKNKVTNYHINIITDNFNEENTNKILSMQTRDVKINIVQLGTKYENLTNNTRWPNIIFYKFEVPFLFKQYDKIILLDADTIVLQDLTELYNTNLNGTFAGVVNDITMILKDDSFTKTINHYFNVGMALFNTKRIREELSLENIISCYENNAKIFLSPEQDTLNYLFKDNLVFLHPKFQYITLYDNYLKSNLLKFYNLKKNSELNRNNITILHFAQMRPWLHFNLAYGDIWYRFYKQSPYYKKLKRGVYNPLLNLYRRLRNNIR